MQNRSRIGAWKFHGLACFISALVLAAGCAHTKSKGDDGKQLRQAAYSGDTEQLQKLLKKHPEMVNAQPDATILTNVVAKRSSALPPTFPELEAEGFAPLHMAAFMGQDKSVKILAACGADLDLGDKTGATPLHLAAHLGFEDICDTLLHSRAALNPRTAKGSTPLHWAAQAGQLRVVRLLVRNGADIQAKTANGETPLQLARKRPYPEVVAYLQQQEKAAK